MTIDHARLDSELAEAKERAITAVEDLPSSEVLSLNSSEIAEVVRHHLVPMPEAGEFFLDEELLELTDHATGRKTGLLGVYGIVPFKGDRKWVIGVRDQMFDDNPLGFADPGRIRAPITFSPQSDDADDLATLAQRRREALAEYFAAVIERIGEHNREIASELTSTILSRIERIMKARSQVMRSGVEVKKSNVQAEMRDRELRIMKKLASSFAHKPTYSDSSDEPRIFIVHGHDDLTKLEVKNYIQNTLKLGEPAVLHELPSQGKTIIEKFEHYAAQIELVFVLLTPDDIAAPASNSNQEKRRARQNVIFELGYFLGRLDRLSGRVMLLYKGDLELPSDLAGVVYIDISAGVEAAGEEIRREMDALHQNTTSA